MRLRAMATVVNRRFINFFRQPEKSFFIEEQFPQVVLQSEGRAFVFVFFKFPPYLFQKGPIFFRSQMCGFFPRCRAIAGKVKAVGPVFYNRIDNVRQFIFVGAGDSGHYRRLDAVASQHSDFLNRRVKRTGLSYHVVRFAHPVDRELISLASKHVKPFADLIIQMKRIAENGEPDAVFMQVFKDIPEP